MRDLLWQAGAVRIDGVDVLWQATNNTPDPPPSYRRDEVKELKMSFLRRNMAVVSQDESLLCWNMLKWEIIILARRWKEVGLGPFFVLTIGGRVGILNLVMLNLWNPASRPAFQARYDKLSIVYIILSCPERYCNRTCLSLLSDIYQIKPQLHPENASGLLEMGLQSKAIHYRTLRILLKHEKGELKGAPEPKSFIPQLTGAHSLCNQR